MKINNLINSAIFAVLLIFYSFYLHAQRYTVENVPNVQLENEELFVTDPGRVIEETDYYELNQILKELRDSLVLEAAVVVLPEIDTDKYGSASDFANRLFNSWGIGSKETNNGLLILLLTAEGEREIVFETGYGIEETLTDKLCKLIQTRIMIPWLKEGEYGRGLIEGVSEIGKVFKGTSTLKESSPKKGLKWPLIIYAVLGFAVIGYMDTTQRSRISGSKSPYKALINSESLKGAGCMAALLFMPHYFIYMLYKAFKKEGSPTINCEKCKAENTVRLTGSPVIKQKALPGQDGLKEYSFLCSKCGFEHKELVAYKYVKPQTKTSSGGAATYRSSGTKGGSWGGGRSGGGGAATKF